MCSSDLEELKKRHALAEEERDLLERQSMEKGDPRLQWLIFYRNAINIGLAILECPAASAGIDNGDEVTVDFDTGVITDVTKGVSYQAEPFPPFIKDMIAKGGLMASLKDKEAAQ